jgi:hypothetical protein
MALPWSLLQQAAQRTTPPRPGNQYISVDSWLLIRLEIVSKHNALNKKAYYLKVFAAL